ncbi:MAG: hypothetical protein LCH61_03360 [Proteobacteria bacterium]|nr:hypothetical protein [Pseudomonadota bacterium]
MQLPKISLPKFHMPEALSVLADKLPFRKRERGGSHMRAHMRHPCCLVAELLIAEKGFRIDGLVIEASRGGIRFREASRFVLDRRGITVVVIIGESQYPGTIVNVGNNGYGIKLDTLISDEEVERLVANNPTPHELMN